MEVSGGLGTGRRVFSKTKTPISRMDVFTLGNEFIDGKNRLKS